ncbi:MAG: hypothetical protein PHU64_05760 [Candidatus Omnitrophica bacterium]|nr:hypothetical protein [Candidatus Omnitrophota bacterium]MDD5429592.1 hypothetical protein [Candidatus Omnitrophota bacterium]
MSQREEILNYFYILKKRRRLGSSYLFVGQEFSLLEDILKLISCSGNEYSCGTCWDCRNIAQGVHPDLHIIEPEGLSTKIESIRQGMRFLSLKSFCLSHKLLIIKDAGSLTLEASNAFLKTLEEPPPNSFIAVCAFGLEGILPTIISRCRRIFFPFVSKKPEISRKEEVTRFLEGENLVFKERKVFSDFLSTLINILHFVVISGIPVLNNKLPQAAGREIILPSLSPEKAMDILKYTARVYEARQSININLGMQLIKTRL